MTAFISHFFAFLGGLGAGVVIKIVLDMRINSRRSTITQTHNRAGGDIVGGSKTDR